MDNRSQIDVARRRGLIPEDLLNFRWLAELALSPSGMQIAYTIRRPDAASNDYISHLYLHDLGTDSAARLTDGDGQVSSIAWSRDSSRVAYSYSEGEGASVRVINVQDDFEDIYPTDGASMTSLDWSADGGKLVGARWTPMRSADDRGPAEGIPKPTIKVVRRLRYKQDGVGWVHDRFLQIWVLELETGDLVQVTHSECDYSSPSWSNRGDRLAFVGMAREQNTPLGYGRSSSATTPTAKRACCCRAGKAPLSARSGATTIVISPSPGTTWRRRSIGATSGSRTWPMSPPEPPSSWAPISTRKSAITAFPTSARV